MASVSSDDPWGRYLLSPSSDSLQGWCTNKSLLTKAFGERIKHVVRLAVVYHLQKPRHVPALVHTRVLYLKWMKQSSMN